LQYGSSGILVDYVYLDSEERRRFAQVGHEYLIEQMQANDGNLQPGSANQSFILNFNHPCKELVFAHKLGAFNGANNNSFLAYTNASGDDAWADALNVAAQNLAYSMILQGTESAPSGAVTSTLAVDSGDTFLTLQLPSGGALFRFTIVTSPPSGSENITVIQNPLVAGNGFNLASELVTVNVDIEYTGSNVWQVLDVEVTSSNLTLEDVSTPLSLFTDHRVATENDIYVVQMNNYGARLDGKGNIVVKGNLVFNGHDRFQMREGNYFNYVQPKDHHTRTPADGINVYSFGLHPEQHQPTGTANMSRIDSVRLNYTVADPLAANRNVPFDIFTGTTVHIYVTNYNVLRIMSGMGGLAYSN